MMATDRDVTKSYSDDQHIEKLERLVACMKDGRAFEIQLDNERIRVPAHAIFSIEHERGDGIEELEFQFRWTIDA
ncbi:amphi-Trp domain-containing protein [Parasphingopyxis algicola]|nr:amphi-Trp domain-containing protein [Parasphingopyxis algicola]